MKFFVFAITVALATAGIANAQTADAVPKDFTAEQKQIAEKALIVAKDVFDSNLKDYASARFRDVKAIYTVQKDGSAVVYFCGKVNSKNGSGGYVGWEVFKVSDDLMMPNAEQSEAFRSAYRSGIDIVCRPSGYKITDTGDWSDRMTLH